MNKTEGFAKKVIYGGSSKIIIEGSINDESLDQMSLDKKIVFRPDLDHLGNFIVQNWKSISLKNETFFIPNEHALLAYDQIKERLKRRKAAGGIIRDGNEYLCIHRNGKWEFPKGKLDKDEGWKKAAEREVFEETGALGKVIDLIQTTFHIYKQDNQLQLKETRWFSMECLEKKKLRPQVKEGITAAEFHPKESIENLFSDSYENILMVWKNYKTLQSL